MEPTTTAGSALQETSDPEQYVNELLGKILKVGKNGTVEPKLTFQHIGKSVTFTFKPDTG